jgi:hypothetical protein
LIDLTRDELSPLMQMATMPMDTPGSTLFLRQGLVHAARLTPAKWRENDGIIMGAALFSKKTSIFGRIPCSDLPTARKPMVRNQWRNPR